MRNIFLSVLFLLLVLPIILSIGAKYYLQHQFVNNFATDVEVTQLNFDHGWFNSNASLNLRLNKQNLTIQTTNQIQQGPIIWKTLLSDPIKSFVLYKIETQFGLLKSPNDPDLSSQPGSALTFVSYLGNSQPSIQHPGIDLSIKQIRVFADLAQIDSKITSGGTIVASLKSNQIELGNDFENVYLIKPEVDITINPEQAVPKKIDLHTINLSGLINTNMFEASGINFTSQLNHSSSGYQFTADILSDQLTFNRAQANSLSANLMIRNLDQNLVDFIATNFDSITQSIQNNQWLVLLKHFSDLLKLINTRQPELSFSINAEAEDQPVKLAFFGKLLSSKDTELNPFSLLENLEMALNAELPKKLMNDLEQPQLIDIIHSMLEKDLLIKNHQSYDANLSFENTKLKVNH